MRHVAATADRIDYWIRRHVVPCPPQGGVNPAALQRYVGLTAIGRCLKDQYDALASPIPPPLATLEARAEPLRIRVCYLHRDEWNRTDAGSSSHRPLGKAPGRPLCVIKASLRGDSSEHRKRSRRATLRVSLGLSTRIGDRRCGWDASRASVHCIGARASQCGRAEGSLVSR